MTRQARRNTRSLRLLLPTLLLATGSSWAGGGHGTAAAMPNMPEQMEHGSGHMDMPGMKHDDADFGRPGKAEAVSRTIELDAQDIRFSTTQLAIKPGSTVRFVVRNTGQLPHEFVLGPATEQQEHAKEMQGMMPDMVHADPNAVSVAPGETKELIWQFSKKPQQLEFACHVPGHFEAGMVGTIDLS